MKIRLLFVAALCLPAGWVLAEGGCPAGQTPAQFGSNVGCIPGGNDVVEEYPQQMQTRPQQSGRWEKTWGAIATSTTRGVLGTVTGAYSEKEAERLAFADCRSQGGEACRVDLTYRNQCAVMVVGKTQLELAGAPSIEEATEDAFGACKAKGDICEVYYSACTEPIFQRY